MFPLSSPFLAVSLFFFQGAFIVSIGNVRFPSGLFHICKGGGRALVEFFSELYCFPFPVVFLYTCVGVINPA